MKNKVFFLIFFLNFFVIVGSSASENECKQVIAQKVSLMETLNLAHRPMATAISNYSQSSLESLEKKIGGSVSVHKNFFNIHAEVAHMILKKQRNRNVIFFARDGEWFYDASILALSMTKGHETAVGSLFLFNASRKIVKHHSDEQLIKFMKSNGIDVDGIIDGSVQVVWVDSGNRGSIFIKLISTILEQIEETDPKKNEKIVNVLTGIDAKLLASRERSTQKQVISHIKKNDFSIQEVQQYIYENLYFDEIFSTSNQREKLGMPNDRYDRYKWVVEYIEHTPHWMGRSTQLSTSGHKVVSTDSVQIIEKARALWIQSQLTEFIKKNKIVKRFQRLLDKRNQQIADQEGGKK